MNILTLVQGCIKSKVFFWIKVWTLNKQPVTAEQISKATFKVINVL